MQRLLAPAAVALVTLFLAASQAAACAPYTFGDDEWNLERGIRWAFLGTVVRDIPSADVPGRPRAMIIAVSRSIVGRPGAATVRIAQSMSCDGFWYRPGDTVVVALPAYDHFHDPPRPLPTPAGDLSSDSVAVWVVDGDRIVGTTRSPMIGGRRLRTVDQLIAALVGLPDTARARPVGGSQPSSSPALAMLAGAVGAALTIRRLARPPRRRAARSPRR